MRKKSTKEILHATIRELLEQKPADEITVKMILAESGIVKSTFYNHFIDKQDLIIYAYDADLKALLQGAAAKEGAPLGLQERAVLVLRFIADNQRFFLNAFQSAGQNCLFQHMVDRAAESFEAYFAGRFPGTALEPAEKSCIFRAMARAVLGMNREYISSACPIPPGEYARHTIGFLIKGVESIYRERQGRP